MKFELHHGDCLDVLKTLADCSVDAIVTDPPYGLGKEPDPVKVMAAWVSQGYFEVEGSGFMGKKWDAFVPQPIIWKEVFRVLKPGGHLLAFAGTRTQDWMAMSLRFAGFEIRDMIAWVYGSGFPKSLDVSKAIDKAAGAEREVIGMSTNGSGAQPNKLNNHTTGDTGIGYADGSGKTFNITAPATEAAKQWEGWGTALKPAVEPVGVYHKGLTLENVFGILMASLTQELWRSICQWSNASASDAENLLSGIRARLEKAEAFSVVESARTFALENIESAILAASSSISPKLTETARDTTKGGSAQEGVNPSGRKLDTQGAETQAGRVDVMSLVDMFICATTEHTGQNIALLWSGILGETLNQANTFTIATALRLTTALKTLKCLMQANTLQSTGSLESCRPALEPITLARKPLIGTVAANVLEHGTGGLNIDGCRVAHNEDCRMMAPSQANIDNPSDNCRQAGRREAVLELKPEGRFPANLIHDGSEEVLALFPSEAGGGFGVRGKGGSTYANGEGFANTLSETGQTVGYGDSGSAARFFYCAKASRDDRDEGCGALELTEAGIKNDSGRGFSESDPMAAVMRHNPHPTVKPTDLMRYLCRLITPPGGIVLDPFTGSGSTGKAAMAEGFRFIGIEREAEYIEIARARISAEAEKPRQLSLF
jgi:DNA modification methylase